MLAQMTTLERLNRSDVDALLLDLDDTLLANDMATFLPEYLALLAKHSQVLLDPDRFRAALLTSTSAMLQSLDTSKSNRDVFWETFLPLTGLARDRAEEHFADFYLGDYEALAALTRRVPGACELVDAAFSSGLRVVVATNPVFPTAAIEARLRWAGLLPREAPFDLVTSFEIMHATKPHAAYYQEIARRIDCAPARMLMVGNDQKADIVGASSAGLHTHRVKSASEALAEGSDAADTVLAEIRAWLG